MPLSENAIQMTAKPLLSALVDGETHARDIGSICARVRQEADLRATWHAYHLIGDALRSDDLASDPRHDLDFILALRRRMAQEPVKLKRDEEQARVAGRQASQGEPLRGTHAPRLRRISVAMAAGLFVALMGTWALTQLSVRGGASVAADRLVAQVQVGSEQQSPLTTSDPPIAVLDGRLIRDSRLDEYFAAHKKFGGSSAPGNPTGFLRSANLDER